MKVQVAPPAVEQKKDQQEEQKLSTPEKDKNKPGADLDKTPVLQNPVQFKTRIKKMDILAGLHDDKDQGNDEDTDERRKDEKNKIPQSEVSNMKRLELLNLAHKS